MNKRVSDLLSSMLNNDLDGAVVQILAELNENGERRCLGFVVSIGQTDEIGVSILHPLYHLLHTHPNKQLWLRCLRDVLRNPLCHLPGALRMAFIVSFELLKLSRDRIDLEEHIHLGRVQTDFMSDEDFQALSSRLKD